jgi:hypothetical protein
MTFSWSPGPWLVFPDFDRCFPVALVQRIVKQYAASYLLIINKSCLPSGQYISESLVTMCYNMCCSFPACSINITFCVLINTRITYILNPYTLYIIRSCTRIYIVYTTLPYIHHIEHICYSGCTCWLRTHVHAHIVIQPHAWHFTDSLLLHVGLLFSARCICGLSTDAPFKPTQH